VRCTVFFLSVIGKVAAFWLWSHAGWRWGAAACFFGPDLFLLFQIFAPAAQGLGPVFTRFETNAAETWLTIDDGPDPEDTPRILDLLDRHQARATFFLVGIRAAQFPALVGEILRRGHDVGHHTHTHPIRSFWCAGPRRLGAELDQTSAALRAAGAQPRWFRPPVGFKNLLLHRALAARNLTCVAWNVRSFDSISSDPECVARRVMKQLKPGSIILMHEGPVLNPAVRVQALERVLTSLTQRGFRCVLPKPEQLRTPGGREMT
jgi:peptidoglycan/xylan/chitin deacetylase (PgdA/CDA1 family)